MNESKGSERAAAPSEPDGMKGAPTARSEPTALRSRIGGANRTIVDRRSDRELVIEHSFDGPVRIVWEAWTKPDLLKRWWAPKSLGVSLFSCDVDLRVGGRYRYVFGRDARSPMAFSGTYTEITPHSRIVCTQIFEPMRDGGEAIVTAAFEGTQGKTRLVLHQLYPSKEVLDGTIASGMERGMRETFEQLEQLVTSVG